MVTRFMNTHEHVGPVDNLCCCYWIVLSRMGDLNQIFHDPGPSTSTFNCESNGRLWTVSVALPSSIVDNAQSPELRSYLIGQIARSLVVFKIDEVVVYDEYSILGYVPFCF